MIARAFRRDQMETALNLSRKSARLLPESAALVMTQSIGEVEVENLH